MSITREQITAAVERYLPRTANYAKSEDLGDRDLQSIFDRIVQIVLTNLLLDQDAIFYIIFLSSQRLLVQIDSVIAVLDALASDEQLRGITGEVPTRIDDISKLSAARLDLVRLSTGLSRNRSFGTEALSDFKGNIEGFMGDQVVPNVVGGNRTKISSDIRSSMESLRTVWDNVLVRRDLVFGLLEKYTDEDLRTRVSSIIIASIQTTLRAFEVAIPVLSTAQQAEQAETTLVELAAADAAITLVGSARDPVGTVIAGPADDGRSLSSYLLLEGAGRTEPVLPVLTGEDGKLRLTGPSAGSPFTSTTGNTIPPGAGTLADRINDGGVASFLAEGVVEGNYITFVDLGLSSSIIGVTAAQLIFSPKIRHRSGDDLRYAVTNHAPGEFFSSPGTSFWSEYTGSTGSTFVDSAVSDAAFVRVNKAAGSDLTNIVISGLTGTARPNELSGASSTQPIAVSNFVSTGAGFISNLITTSDLLYVTGANVGGNPYSISIINSENDLDIVGTWGAAGAGSWHIEDVNASLFFNDSSTTFLSTPIPVANLDILRVTSGASNQGDYVIDSVLSQVRVKVANLAPAPFTNETGLDWEILHSVNDVLFSATTNFHVEGVTAGDTIEVSGTASDDGTYGIIEVTATYIRIDTVLSGDTISGASFEIYGDVGGAVTVKLTKVLGGNFDVLGVGPTMTVNEIVGGVPRTLEVPAIIRVGVVDYAIRELDPNDPDDTLFIQPLVDGIGDFLSATVFEDTNAQFVTKGVDDALHELVIQFGANSVRSFPITTVSSETQLVVTGSPVVSAGESYEILPKIIANQTWAVYRGLTTRHFFDNTSLPFTADMVGKELVWRPNEPEEVRTFIDTFVSSSEIWLSGYLPANFGGGPTYAIVDVVIPGMQLATTSTRYEILNVVDENTLQIDPKISNGPGNNLTWQVVQATSDRFVSRICDPIGATEYDVSQGSPGLGFTTGLAGVRVDLMVDRPIQAVFVAPYDPGADGFSEAFAVSADMPLGYRNVTYRILSSFSGQSNVFVALEVNPLPLEADFLAVWEQEDIFRITEALSDTPDMKLTVNPSMQAGLVDRSYAVTQGGSQYYGRYLLFDSLNNSIELDPTTDLLRLTVAEVLIDFGTEIIVIEPGAGTGEVAEDGDEDGFATTFSDETKPADFSSAEVGDRLTVTYPGPEIEVTFVTLVLGDTRLRVDPPLPEGSSLTWVLERNSVSAALGEVSRLRGQMAELRSLVTSYTIPRNPVVDAVLDLLVEQRLSRAIDLIYDGEIDLFINLDVADASYSSRARGSVQGVGAGIFSTPKLADNVAGIDPETGRRSPSNTKSTSRESAVGLSEEVETRVALAEGVADLFDDELMRSLLYATDEEQRNRAIFVLGGIVESGFIGDEDPTLPWIAKTGSIQERVTERRNNLLAALQYMLDHPDEFCEAESVGSIDEVGL